MTSRRTLLAAAGAACLATAPAEAATLFDAVAANPQLGTVAALLRKAGMESTLRTQAGVTLHAPTNTAIEAMPCAAYRRLTETAAPAELQGVIRARMVSFSQPIPPGTEATAVMTRLGGTQLAFQGIGSSTVRVNGALRIVGAVLPTP